MKPYYSDALVTLFHGDFRNAIDIERSDLVLTDPPYEETGLAWDRWPKGWPAKVLQDFLKPTGSLWCWGSMRMFLEFASEFDAYRCAQDIVWEKHNGSSFHNDRFRRVHECALHFYSRKAKWNSVWRSSARSDVTSGKAAKTGRIIRRGKPAHWNREVEPGAGYVFDGSRLVRSVMAERSAHHFAVHPTQKPLGITRTLLAYSCPPGGLVTDIFSGGGDDVGCREGTRIARGRF